MTSTPADTSLNLTPHAHQRCCNLFACCLPTKGGSEEDENEEPNDRDLGLNLPELPLVADERDTATAIGDPSAEAAASGLGEDPEKKKLLVKPNAQINNNVLVAFLHALLSLLLFNFNNNNRDNASGSGRRALQTTTVGGKDDDDAAVEETNVGDDEEDDDDAVEETHVNILQTGEDEFEIEEIPFIRAEE